MGVGGVSDDALCCCDVMRCAGDGVLIGDVGELPIQVVVHNIQALKCWSLGNDILQPIREDIAWTSVLKHCSCHTEVLRIVKHSVSIEEEMTGFI